MVDIFKPLVFTKYPSARLFKYNKKSFRKEPIAISNKFTHFLQNVLFFLLNSF